MNNGIEKLQKYAFGMSPRQCDDILLLADQIKREHASELQAIEAEMDKRLMPEGLEWPRFDDGEKVKFGDQFIRYDGEVSPVFKFAVNTIDGFNVFDSEGEFIITHGKRIKRPGSEVLGADGLPIKVGETVWYVGEPLVRGTVEAVGEGEVMLAGDGVYAPLDLTHTQPDTQERIDDDATMYPHEYCKKHGIQAGTPDNATFALSDFVEPMALDLLRRQRELDARTMGGE